MQNVRLCICDEELLKLKIGGTKLIIYRSGGKIKIKIDSNSSTMLLRGKHVFSVPEENFASITVRKCRNRNAASIYIVTDKNVVFDHFEELTGLTISCYLPLEKVFLFF